MKIIHCADLHLDSKMESNLDRDAANLRRDELLETFENMIDYAQDNGVSVIIIAGDLFDKPNIRKSAKNRVMDQIKGHPDIDFCYLRGNHDRCDFVDDLEEDTEIRNVKLFSSTEWTTYSYDQVDITGIELTKENSQTLGTNLVLDQNRLNIVTLHGQESDYQGNDKTEIINLSLLRNKYIDYLALGHIHSYKKEKLDDRGYYCYSGCIEGRGFDECGEKGFVVLDIEDGKISTEFVPIASRQLHEVEVEITPEMSVSDIVALAQAKVEDIPSEDMVKIIITGKVDMDSNVNTRRIIRNIEKDFFLIKVYDRTSVAINYDDFRNDKSLKGEFVRLMEQQDMPEEKRSAIIELGMKAILGEELE